MRATPTHFGVRIEGGPGLAIDLVEHLLAALGGLGIHEGVAIEVEGPELPILDQGPWRSPKHCASSKRRASRPAPRVFTWLAPARSSTGGAAIASRRATGSSSRSRRYSKHPASGRSVPAGETPRASSRKSLPRAPLGLSPTGRRCGLWGGPCWGFPQRVKDREAARALARAVLLFDETGHPVTAKVEAREPQENEVARHKLLDLVGDFALYGGPPRGSVFASRPGHTATHAIIGEALGLGLLSTR